ncbi:MAG: DUF3365 domain-containing protein, partial [Moorea sp. SIO4A3]|nr:DUF3365 domain-containing protein [Moorena sp. SIO4A3]
MAIKTLLHRMKTKAVGLIALGLAICVTVVACGDGSSQQAGGVAPELVVDYIHTVLLADRTAYTKHVINRLKKLEGKDKPKGVVDAEATEGWQQTGGIPLPA